MPEPSTGPRPGSWETLQYITSTSLTKSACLVLSTQYIQNHFEIITVPFSRLVRFIHHIPNVNILQMIALSKADPEASVFPCKEHVPSFIKISVLGQKISWPSRYLSVQLQPAFQTSDCYSSDSKHTNATDWLRYIKATCNANHSPERFCSLKYFYVLTRFEVRARTA